MNIVEIPDIMNIVIKAIVQYGWYRPWKADRIMQIIEANSVNGDAELLAVYY